MREAVFIEHKKRDVEWAVDMQKERIRTITALALNFATDPEKKKRREEQYCVCCFYRESTIAGQAFTESKCRVCAKHMHWSTTHQEKICGDCAKLNGLCKECGATVDLKEPRYLKSEHLQHTPTASGGERSGDEKSEN